MLKMFLHIASLIVLLVCSSRSSWALQCLVNKKSSTTYKHVTSQPCKTIHPTTNVTQLHSNASLSKDLDITDCMVFKSVHKKDVKLSCDFQHHCKQRNTSIMTLVEGEKGLLYCCKSDNCNTVDIAETMKVKNSTCIKGNESTIGVSTHISTVQCYGKKCISEKLVWSKEVRYDCDVNDTCEKHNVPVNTSKRIADYGTIFCCEGNNCNHNSLQIPMPNTPLATVPPGSNLRPGNAQPGSLNSRPSSELNWLLVGALIGAVVVSFLVIVVTVVIIRHCRYQRLLSHQRAYSYQQLTADFATDDLLEDEVTAVAISGNRGGGNRGDDKLIIA